MQSDKEMISRSDLERERRRQTSPHEEHCHLPFTGFKCKFYSEFMPPVSNYSEPKINESFRLTKIKMENMNNSLIKSQRTGN